MGFLFFICVFQQLKITIETVWCTASRDFPCGRNSFDSKLELIGIMLASSRSVFEIQFEVFICLCVPYVCLHAVLSFLLVFSNLLQTSPSVSLKVYILKKSGMFNNK